MPANKISRRPCWQHTAVSRWWATLSPPPLPPPSAPPLPSCVVRVDGQYPAAPPQIVNYLKMLTNHPPECPRPPFPLAAAPYCERVIHWNCPKADPEMVPWYQNFWVDNACRSRDTVPRRFAVCLFLCLFFIILVVVEILCQCVLLFIYLFSLIFIYFTIRRSKAVSTINNKNIIKYYAPHPTSPKSSLS
jgi:hypothetical protein